MTSALCTSHLFGEFGICLASFACFWNYKDGMKTKD